MTRKTSTCYTALFQYIEKNIFNLQPKEIMTDFEGGMRNSIKMVYPNVILRGCWFHYCSAIRKKVVQLGLYPLTNRNRKAKLIFKEIMSLPLLPAANIVQGFIHIKKLANVHGLLGRFIGFFTYFESFWLLEVSYMECSNLYSLYLRCALYSKNQKNGLSVADLNMRTTSSLESINSHIGRSFPKHPNIFKFIDCLKQYEYTRSTKMRKLIQNCPKRQMERKHNKDKEREKKIKHFTSLFRRKKINLGIFLEAMSNKTILPLNGMCNGYNIYVCFAFFK